MRILALALWVASNCHAQSPSADVLKQVLEKRLLALRPTGTSERQVLFQSVTPLPKNGAFFPFRVTALIRDYGTGYPPNGYFGETCVQKIDDWTYNLSQGPAGNWVVDGRMTVTGGPPCAKNPSAGVSSVPLASLTGTAAPQGSIAAPTGSAELHMGEWACYGVGGRVLMGFFLKADGSYLDRDRKTSGRYSLNKAGGTIAFQGGFMDGQTGRGIRGQRFELSNSVGCEPWH